MEALDRMFPDGYVCVYTCPDHQIRMSLYNPHKLEQLEKVRQEMMLIDL